MPKTKWERASSTDISLIEAVIQVLLDQGASIIIGDCGFKDQWQATIYLSKYDVLPKKYGVELIGLQEGKRFHEFTLVRANHQYKSLFGVKISDVVLSCDAIINLPKLKVHKMALVTGAIKNMMGIIAQKGNMHPRGSIEILHKRLHDLYFIMKDKVSFCIMDGIVGSEYSEHYGLPVQSNIIITSEDMWGMDCQAANFIGINPQEVPYLRWIKETLGIPYPTLTAPPYHYERPLGWRK